MIKHNHLKCEECDNYYILRTNKFGQITRGLRFSNTKEMPKMFVEWYRLYYGDEIDKNTTYQFAMDKSDEYERWCEKNRVESSYDA